MNKFEKEAKMKYGNDVVEASMKKLKGYRPDQMKEIEALSTQIKEVLREALQTADPSSQLAQKACQLHEQWICMFWPEGLYSKEAHLQLVASYLEDERFVAYYDAIASGCTAFFYEAIKIYCK